MKVTGRLISSTAVVVSYMAMGTHIMKEPGNMARRKAKVLKFTETEPTSEDTLKKVCDMVKVFSNKKMEPYNQEFGRETFLSHGQKLT